MKKKLILVCVVTILFLAVSACNNGIFGVDEGVWNTLNEEERIKVIDGYNKRKELQLIQAQKRREMELENEKRQQELDAVSSVFGLERERSFVTLRIQSISSDFHRQKISIEGEKFEVSPFSRMSDAWIRGQRVELRKDEEEPFYPVKIHNLENGEKINVRKAK